MKQRSMQTTKSSGTKKRMTRATLGRLAIAAGIAVGAVTAHQAWADDETDDTEIRVVAPIEATDCTAVPATIQVLGLTIDVSAATVESAGADDPTPSPTASATPAPAEPGDDSGGHHGGKVTGTTPGCYYYCTTPVPTVTAVPTPAAVAADRTVAGCAGLVVGQTAEVTLVSDAAPLAAVRVGQSGGHHVELKAPIQSADTAAQTVTVLGLTVDLSHAEVNGADDHSDDANTQPIDLSQLLPGQFVELKLDGATAPLSAGELEVKNFTNQLEVEIQDSHGHDVNDVDDNGNPDDDVQVQVVETVSVQNPNGTAAPSRVKKTVALQTTSSGRLTLSGLATGRARIFVTRVHAGTTTVGIRSVPVRGDSSRHVRVRLRPSVRH